MARRVNKIKRTEGIIMNDSSTIIGGDFEESVDVFLHNCRLRNLSQHTVKSYRSELATFKKILYEQEVDPSPSRVTSKVIKENVILYMLDVKGLRDVTINTRLRTLKTFFNFLFKERYIG